MAEPTSREKGQGIADAVTGKAGATSVIPDVAFKNWLQTVFNPAKDQEKTPTTKVDRDPTTWVSGAYDGVVFASENERDAYRQKVENKLSVEVSKSFGGKAPYAYLEDVKKANIAASKSATVDPEAAAALNKGQYKPMVSYKEKEKKPAIKDSPKRSKAEQELLDTPITLNSPFGY